MSSSAGGPGERVMIPAQVRSNVSPSNVASVTVRLERGGSGWPSYNATLPSHLKRQWDAYEAFLMRLAESRYLYVVGGFEPVADEAKAIVVYRHTTLLRGRELPQWEGLYGPCQSQKELHDVFLANPLDVFHMLFPLKIKRMKKCIVVSVKIERFNSKRPTQLNIESRSSFYPVSIQTNGRISMPIENIILYMLAHTFGRHVVAHISETDPGWNT